MDFLVLFIPGLLSFTIIYSDKSFESRPGFKEILCMARNLMILIYVNIISYLLGYKILFNLGDSFIDGRLNPLMVSVKGLMIILLVSLFLGYTIKKVNAGLWIRITSERTKLKKGEAVEETV